MLKFSFNKDNVVKKTYTKTGGTTKEQMYHGIKFKRSAVTSGINEQFTISNTLWDQMQLDNADRGLVEYTDENGTFLILCDTENATMFKTNKRNSGEGRSKVKFCKNSILSANLVKAGLLDAEAIGNVFLSAVRVEEIEDQEDWIFDVYKLELDTTVNQEEADEDEEESEEEEEA